MLTGKLDLPSDPASVKRLVIHIHGTGPGTYLDHRKMRSGEFNYFDLFASEFTKRGTAFFAYNKRGVEFGDIPPYYDKVDREKYKKCLPSIEVKDIDMLINRALVYGTLTVSLVLMYVSCIIGLQFLLRGMLNQNTDVAIVGSTLIIAALFQPLRQRIQQVIDRRFYRHKYDAARTLAAFSATLRNEVDLNQLREQLVGVVQETMQPAHVSLWLRNPQQDRERNTRLLPRIDEEERGPS